MARGSKCPEESVRIQRMIYGRGKNGYTVTLKSHAAKAAARGLGVHKLLTAPMTYTQARQLASEVLEALKSNGTS